MKKTLIFTFLFIISLLVIEYYYRVNYISYYYEKLYRIKYEEKYEAIYKEKFETYARNIRYNQCVYNKIPKITGLLETAQYLRYTNSSIVRFGDGEMLLMDMNGTSFQKADKELSRRLRETFDNNLPSCVVALPNVVSRYHPLAKDQYIYYDSHKEFEEWILKNANHSRQYFDTLITSPFICTYGTSCELIDNVYKELREIWRNKDIVMLRGNNGETYKYDVYDTAKSQIIYYGKAKEAWSEYEYYKRFLMKENKTSLFIISIRPTSKVLVYDLVKKGRRALDLGHLAKDYNCYKSGIFDKRFY